MRIIVPVKQVPETSNVKMDPETGTIVRAGSEAVVNPLDLYAIEAALRLREEHGGTVEVVSMGPPRAEVAVREAIAMGCDGGTLVSDKRFGGADTWSTSYVLSRAIARMGEYDLVVTGERATDGDTAQVGPGIASWLDIPVATYVARVTSVDRDGETITVERLIEEGYQQARLKLPALITVVKEIATPRIPTLAGKRRARQTEVPVLTRDDMEVEPSWLGLRGSPTKVVKIRTPKVTRGGRLVRADEDVSGAAAELLSFLRERDLVREETR